MTEALLILLNGHTTYYQDGTEIELADQFDCVRIPAKVRHKLKGNTNSMLLLIQ